MQSNECANCAAPLTPAYVYCPQCGQKAQLHRLSLHELGHDVFHYFVHADKGFLLLLQQLCTRTGAVAREYVLGMRKKHFPPLNFFLLCATIYVFLVNIYTPHNSGLSAADKAYLQHIPEPGRQYVTRIYERRDTATHFINKYSNFIYMFATPLITLLMWLFYTKKEFNYTEHVVANLYISGFTALCYVLVFVPIALLLHTDRKYALFAYFAFELFYRTVFYSRFMKRVTMPAGKAFAASLVAMAAWIFLSYYAVYFYISNGWWGLFA